jgi:hypothetical protein
MTNTRNHFFFGGGGEDWKESFSNSRQGVVLLQLRWLGEGLTTSNHKIKRACYEMLHMTSEFVASSCEHGNEPSGSIKGGELFD